MFLVALLTVSWFAPHRGMAFATTLFAYVGLSGFTILYGVTWFSAKFTQAVIRAF
jgi:hypothetical protein